MSDIKIHLVIDATSDRVYGALTQQRHLAKWWTTSCEAKPIIGSKARFNFKKARFFTVMEITSLKPDKIEWTCIEAGAQDHKEWVGTSVVWEISDADGKSSLSMDHKDWKGETELYRNCTDGWAFYTSSLKSYLETGRGSPYSDN
jgi:uncharacterized protein YndB with AHSA1/START domain